jgi:hypothetical protein
MTVLDRTYVRTLDDIVTRYAGEAPGTRLEFWTFDNASHRKEAEHAFMEHGLHARVHSAYKPLLHYFLEDVDRTDLKSIEIVYPTHPECAPDRFLLEAYPLPALFDGMEVRFTPDGSGGLNGFVYVVRLCRTDGREETVLVSAPNRRYVDHTGSMVISSAGWMRIRTPDGMITEQWLKTEYESIFLDAVAAVSEHPWGTTEPFFDRMAIKVRLPVDDVPLPLGEEVISLREAMHEELYFSVLEVFQIKTGRPISDRTIRPGQVVPDVAPGGIPSLSLELVPLQTHDAEGASGSLDTMTDPIAASRVAAALEMPGGRIFGASARSGRQVLGMYHPGSDAAVMISGGQHANETTGVVGALRAARELSRRHGSHFEVSPLENPDGYAVHEELCVTNPRHMHHAARYTALGNDLEYQDDAHLYEKALRVEAQRLSDAKLHVNLHGYACHEWTRPLTGYIPRGFPTWMLPHGFFLLLRHHESWARFANDFLDRLTRRLATVPGLLSFTQGQLELYSRFVGTPPFRIMNGFPCDLSINEASTIPLRLITEYPDETIHGAAFVAGHTAQKETVLAAYDIFQSMQPEMPAREVAL